MLHYTFFPRGEHALSCLDSHEQHTCVCHQFQLLHLSGNVRLNFEETKKLLGTGLAEKVRKKSEELFSYGESFFRTIGIDVIDTKFEFAMEDGELILIE